MVFNTHTHNSPYYKHTHKTPYYSMLTINPLELVLMNCLGLPCCPSSWTSDQCAYMSSASSTYTLVCSVSTVHSSQPSSSFLVSSRFAFYCLHTISILYILSQFCILSEINICPHFVLRLAPTPLSQHAQISFHRCYLSSSYLSFYEILYLCMCVCHREVSILSEWYIQIHTYKYLF